MLLLSLLLSEIAVWAGIYRNVHSTSGNIGFTKSFSLRLTRQISSFHLGPAKSIFARTYEKA